jgi:hypothetical protein
MRLGKRRTARTAAAVALASAAVASVLTFVPWGAPPAPPPVPLAEAADGATAAFAARQQGTRVEVASERTTTRTVYANPGGTMTAELSPVPVRVRRGASWVEVDTALQRRADGRIVPKAADGDLSLSPGGKDAPLLTLRRAGRTLALHWPTALPEPVVADSAATYRDVIPGADLVIFAEPGGYRQHLVVKDAAAARNPALRAIGMRIEADGLTVKADKQGALTVVDGKGDALFTAPPSSMWDSAGKITRFGVSVADGHLVLKPDAEFLADATLTFPVTIDPVLTTAHRSAWATVLSGKSGTAYWNTSGDGTYAQVGQCPRDLPGGWCNGIGEAWAYFQFDTGFLSDKDVLGATLNTTVASSPACADRVHELYHAGPEIWNGMTWNSRLSGNLVAERWMPSVHGTCSGWKGAGIDVATHHIEKSAPTVLFLKAKDSGDQYAWRKLDPGQTNLLITYNRAPHLPAHLGTDPPLPAPCGHCGGKPYLADTSVRLMATLSDPDGDPMDVNWRVTTDGVDADTGWIGSGLASGAVHSHTLDLTAQDGKTVGWAVAGGDRTAASAWANGPSQFVVDRVGITAPPTVASELYTQDDRWHGGTDVPGVFTFGSSGVGDVDHYLYGWQDPPTTKVQASALGGPAEVTLTPPGDGPRELHVRSVDRAGHKSPTRVHRFYVRAGNGPLAQWSFDGNAQDTAFLGDRHGTLGGGATYTAQGAVGGAVQLDGVDDHVTAPTAIRNGAGYSVSAWVKPTRADGARAVVSQDGAFMPGFVLWYRAQADGSSPYWAFAVPNSTASDKGAQIARSQAGVPELNTWTHLAGVYDPAAKQVRLYVNGALAGSVAHTAKPEFAAGPVRIGRTMWSGTAVLDHWRGAIDEVQIHDRVLTPAEIAATVGGSNVQVAHYKFDDGSGTTARNASGTAPDGVLEGGAAFTPDGASGGGVRFDGVDGGVSTTTPLVRTDQSFSVAAQVKLDRADNGVYTALSQDGEHNSAFYLQYQSNRWIFVLPRTDEPAPAHHDWVRTESQPAPGVWTHLAGVYDAATGKIRLYVDGELIGETTRTTPWQARRAFRVGQSLLGGELGQRFPGSVDEVRVYSRAISQDEVRGLLSTDGVTAGTWRLDGTPEDVNGALNGTEAAGADWAAGQVSLPDPGDLAVRLNGIGGHISTAKAVDTDKSFSVAAWARLDKAGGNATVLSQDGGAVSGFMLRSVSGRWSLLAMPTDAVGTGSQALGPPVQPGIWTHLAGVYSRDRGRIELYVNGVLAASAPHAGGFAAGGGFQIGRGKWGGASADFFTGAIDDVSVYRRTLFAGEIQTMAGRDLGLGHNWTLDEGRGGTVGDSAGARQAALSGGAAFTRGRVGNAVSLDGVDDAVSAPGVDVRTDSSFSVSTWVRLRGNDCDMDITPRCLATAVSLDGGVSGGQERGHSKFRLGHVKDDNEGLAGNWVFEMPEEDGAVTKAAVEVIPGDLDNWVHLVGVYDAGAKAIYLYVDGTRRDDGTLLTPWQATGALQLGRGQAGGAYTGHWRGDVDDVRMYSGALTGDRAYALFRGYPAEQGSSELPAPNEGEWTFDDNTGTTAADSSGRGRDATLSTGATWHPGRDRTTGWFDGASGHAETAGPVVDTESSFSVAAWAFLRRDDRYVTVFGQDGARISPFSVQYDPAAKKWGALAPKADQTEFQSHYVLSSEPAAVGTWTHLALVYEAQLGQLRLYVNGLMSGVQTGVAVLPAPGKFAIGRCKWGEGNGCFFPGGIDEVRAFGKALSDGEVRRVHDDVPPALHGYWRFDDSSPRDYSPRALTTTATGTPTYVDGVIGKAMVFDGSTSLAASGPGVTMQDSFTVAAWARLGRADRVATVLGQDGARNSGILLQYRPEVGRWIFGAAAHDADQAESTPLRHAASLRAPALNTWTHLAGVYDAPARQLRLYVDGELAGTRDGVLLWSGMGSFTVGRGKANGQPTGLFTGALDEVTTDLGVASDEEIRARAGSPVPAGGQLARFTSPTDHRSAYAANGVKERFPGVPAGYRFETSLGGMLKAEVPGSRRLYSCLINDTDAFTSMDAACEGHTKLADLGWVYVEPPSGVATLPLNRCLSGERRFDSNSATCEGKTVDGLLGYVLAYAPLTRYYHPRIGEHAVSTSAVPRGYRHEGTFGVVPMTEEPGTVPLMSCVDGVDRFLSTDTGCDGKTVEVRLGSIWAQAPAGRPSTALYQCSMDYGPSAGQLFVSSEPGCEGQTVRGPFGHVLTAQPVG